MNSRAEAQPLPEEEKQPSPEEAMEFVTLVTLLFPFLVGISFIYYLFYVNN
jgi:hypothetical protein